jgi:uncharacterized membrane protein YgcG
VQRELNDRHNSTIKQFSSLIKKDIKITPAEYLYLQRPYWSDAEDMIRATLQTLCYRNVLTLEEKYVYLNENDRRQVLRLFLKTGPAYHGYITNSRAEKFLLEAFRQSAEQRFYELRNYILLQLDKDTERFKKEYVCNDLKEKGLLDYSLFRSRAGKSISRELKEKLVAIDQGGEHLFLPENHLVKSGLEELGPNAVLLSRQTIERLSSLLPVLETLMLLDERNASFAIYSKTASLTSGVIGTFSGAGSYGGGSADFGGGAFGGGGASGEW